MMDETDIREHWLLNALEDDGKHIIDNVGCVVDASAFDRLNLSPTPTEESSLIDEDLDMEDIPSSSLQANDCNDAGDASTSAAASPMIKTEHQTEPATIEQRGDDESNSGGDDADNSEDKKKKDDNNNERISSDNEEGTGIPTKFDVLCGQSRICASHIGNKRFQVVLDMYATRYESATSKQEKMALTKEIVGCITTSGGRFLKYKDGMWQEISTVMARDKVSHALRTKNASWKKQQEEQVKQRKASGKATTTGGKPKRAMSTSAAISSVAAAAAAKDDASKRKTHRRRSSAPVAAAAVARRRRSSTSIFKSLSEGGSFDGNDSSSSNIMDSLLSKQREIFASLTKTSDKDGNSVHPLKKWFLMTRQNSMKVNVRDQYRS